MRCKIADDTKSLKICPYFLTIKGHYAKIAITLACHNCGICRTQVSYCSGGKKNYKEKLIIFNNNVKKQSASDIFLICVHIICSDCVPFLLYRLWYFFNFLLFYGEFSII